MVRYLDNDQSAGPRSRVVAVLARRAAGSDTPARRHTVLTHNHARNVADMSALRGGARGRVHGWRGKRACGGGGDRLYGTAQRGLCDRVQHRKLL